MVCKILLTSRDPDVLSSKMGAKKVFEVPKLEDDEAWKLFKKIVGKNVEKPTLQPIAKEIVEKCLGLPVAIASVGNAMKGKTQQYKWENALVELKKPSPKGLSAAVYKPIELSYNYLEEEELKQTFILCSLLGHQSSVEDLLKYGMGLDLFHKANTMEETRARLLTWVSHLKLSSLLVDGHSSIHFDMHDQIREVALSIASRDHGVFALVDDDGRKKWPDKGTMENLKWIYLSNGDIKLPQLKCPQLTFFHLSNKGGRSLEVPPDLFAGIEGLKVLHLTNIDFEKMPLPIPIIPTNLHTLLLDQCVFRVKDIGAILGNLENLEVLSLAGSDIEELPRDLGKLVELKLLDLSDCTKLSVIPQQVLASLSKLEELKMGNSFTKWDVGEGNARLAELTKLHKVTNLEVVIPNFRMIPKDIFSEKLKRYKIFIGDEWKYSWDSSFESSKLVKLKLGASISSDHSIRKLLKNTDELCLERLNGVKNLVYELDGEGFQHLKYLNVQNAPDIQRIFYSGSWRLVPSHVFPILEVLTLCNLENMEKIGYGPIGVTSFSKLRMITIVCCHQLKNLFSFSIVGQLLQLQEIAVTDCENIEEIVEEQGSRNDILDATEGVLGRLRSLRLQHLPKLISFNSNYRGMPLFNDQVLLPNLEELQLSWINVNTIWHTFIASSSVENLTKLIIQGCHHLKYLLSSSLARCLVKLGHLEIRECKMMRMVFFTENVDEKETLIFPQLNFLQLIQLQSLVNLYLGNCIIEFPSLKQLAVRNCPELRGFAIKSTSRDFAADIQPLFGDQVAFPSLERMTISHLRNMTTLWHDQLHGESFGKLKSLKVLYCEKLMTILPCNNMLGSFWTSVEELKIHSCGSLEVVFELGEFNTNQRPVVIDTQLRVLDIWNLPRLKHVWNKDPERIFTFHNLESVCVSGCKSLNNLFPASVAKDLLQLKTLEIMDSGLEEIVAMGGRTEEDVRFEFPQVSRLVLNLLPRLSYFYPGKHTTEWPMLKKFYFRDCGNVKKTNGQGQIDFPVQQPLFSTEKVIVQLEELSLSKDDIAMICDEPQFKEDIFFNTKLLRIQDYLDHSAALPILFLLRFSNLEKLVLRDCYFKELLHSKGDQVEQQEKHIEMEALSKINTLKLDSLPYLTHIWKHDSPIVLQNLHTLKVWRCERLICLSTSKTIPFQNLTTLEVWRCHGCMTNLVSVSMVQSLVQLQRLTVRECKNLTEIVGSEDGTEDLIINFRKLRFFKLHCLSRLEIFCSGNFIFKFPFLEKVIVNQCPKLKIFSEGDPNTPLLERVELIEGEDKWRWAGGLNATIQRMYMEKVGYAGLKDLILSDFPELMERWHIRKSPQEILDFRLLQDLQIYDCSNFTYLLTPFMVFCLVQLQSIKVKNCGMMEQVILGEGEESKMIFPELWWIRLESCSNLTSFYAGSDCLEIPALEDIIIVDCPKMVAFSTSTSSVKHEKEVSKYFFSTKVEIPVLEALTLSSISIQQIWNSQLSSISSFVQHLRKLIVKGCGSLKSLLTSSMVKSFVQLEVLKIHECEMMEVVIQLEELGEEQRMYQMVFSKLETLELEDLPQLIRFCSHSDSLVEISELQGFNGSETQVLPATQSTLVETEAPKLLFPQVTCLKLILLPKYKSFFPQRHVTEWASLKSMFVYGCNGLQIFASEFPGLESQTQHPMFWISKATFPSLEELKFEWNYNMEEIWCGQHPEEYFSKLKVVELFSSFNESAFLPPFFFQSLPNLEKLVVSDALLSEIFQCEEVGADEKSVCGRTPSKLRQSKLHELTHLWKEESLLKLVLNNLRTLKVQECSRLKNLVPSTIYFNNLQILEVSGCHGLVNLMRYSTARSLVQLTKMAVINCEIIQEIVVCLGNDVKDGIVFTKLECLQLEGLPRLVNFCSGDCNFEFPDLEDVIVTWCPRMQTFSRGELRTPKLQDVKLTPDKDEGRWEGNLNSTVQQLFKGKSDRDSEEDNAHGFEEETLYLNGGFQDLNDYVFEDFNDYVFEEDRNYGLKEDSDYDSIKDSDYDSIMGDSDSEI